MSLDTNGMSVSPPNPAASSSPAVAAAVVASSFSSVSSPSDSSMKPSSFDASSGLGTPPTPGTNNHNLLMQPSPTTDVSAPSPQSHPHPISHHLSSSPSSVDSNSQQPIEQPIIHAIQVISPEDDKPHAMHNDKHVQFQTMKKVSTPRSRQLQEEGATAAAVAVAAANGNAANQSNSDPPARCQAYCSLFCCFCCRRGSSRVSNARSGDDETHTNEFPAASAAAAAEHSKSISQLEEPEYDDEYYSYDNDPKEREAATWTRRVLRREYLGVRIRHWLYMFVSLSVVVALAAYLWQWLEHRSFNVVQERFSRVCSDRISLSSATLEDKLEYAHSIANSIIQIQGKDPLSKIDSTRVMSLQRHLEFDEFNYELDRPYSDSDVELYMSALSIASIVQPGDRAAFELAFGPIQQWDTVNKVFVHAAVAQFYVVCLVSTGNALPTLLDLYSIPYFNDAIQKTLVAGRMQMASPFFVSNYSSPVSGDGGVTDGMANRSQFGRLSINSGYRTYGFAPITYHDFDSPSMIDPASEYQSNFIVVNGQTQFNISRLNGFLLSQWDLTNLIQSTQSTIGNNIDVVLEVFESGTDSGLRFYNGYVNNEPLGFNPYFVDKPFTAAAAAVASGSMSNYLDADALEIEVADVFGFVSTYNANVLYAGLPWVARCTPTASYASSEKDWSPTVIGVMCLFGCVLFLIFFIVHFRNWNAKEREVRFKNQVLTELQGEREKAEQAGLAKTDFMAFLCHELRNPLHAVLSMSDSLKETTLDPDQAESVYTIHASSELMLAITNDILDLSKIEAGKIELETIPMDVTALVQSLVRANSSWAADKGVSVIGVIDPRVREYNFIYADPTRLNQMLTNLMSNAIKFTPKHGTVTLEVAIEEVPLTERSRRDSKSLLHPSLGSVDHAGLPMSENPLSGYPMDAVPIHAPHPSFMPPAINSVLENVSPAALSAPPTAQSTPATSFAPAQAPSPPGSNSTTPVVPQRVPSNATFNAQQRMMRPSQTYTKPIFLHPRHSADSPASIPTLPQVIVRPPSPTSVSTPPTINRMESLEPDNNQLSDHVGGVIVTAIGGGPSGLQPISGVFDRSASPGLGALNSEAEHSQIATSGVHGVKNVSSRAVVVHSSATQPTSAANTPNSVKPTARHVRRATNSRHDSSSPVTPLFAPTSPLAYAPAALQATLPLLLLNRQRRGEAAAAAAAAHVGSPRLFGQETSTTSSPMLAPQPHGRRPDLPRGGSREMRSMNSMDISSLPGRPRRNSASKAAMGLHSVSKLSQFDKPPPPVPIAPPAMSAAGQLSEEAEEMSRAQGQLGSVRLMFRVIDTGIGIPQEYMSALFEPYSQAKRSITRSHGGTGLGLAIVKRLGDLMRGELSVESEVGAGTNFTFSAEFLVAKVPTPAMASMLRHIQPTDPDIAQVRYSNYTSLDMNAAANAAILISNSPPTVDARLISSMAPPSSPLLVSGVDHSIDMPDLAAPRSEFDVRSRNRERTQHKSSHSVGFSPGEALAFDSNTSLRVQVMKQGPGARSHLKNNTSGASLSPRSDIGHHSSYSGAFNNHHPVSMTNMNPSSLNTMEIRRPEPMLTRDVSLSATQEGGSGSEADSAHATPVAPLKSLPISVTTQHTDHGGPTPAPSPTVVSALQVNTVAPPAVKKPFVLVVDDAAINRKILLKMLGSDYEIDQAENGLQAVELVDAHPNRYSVVLMDLMMPVMSGTEALQQIRIRGHTSLPVIAVTANTMNEDIDTCLSIGFTSFLSKPCRKELVRSMVKQYADAFVANNKGPATSPTASKGSLFARNSVTAAPIVQSGQIVASLTPMPAVLAASAGNASSAAAGSSTSGATSNTMASVTSPGGATVPPSDTGIPGRLDRLEVERKLNLLSTNVDRVRARSGTNAKAATHNHEAKAVLNEIFADELM